MSGTFGVTLAPFDADALQRRVMVRGSGAPPLFPGGLPSLTSLEFRNTLATQRQAAAASLPPVPTEQQRRVSAKRATKDLKIQQAKASYSGGLARPTRQYEGNIQMEEFQAGRADPLEGDNLSRTFRPEQFAPQRTAYTVMADMLKSATGLGPISQREVGNPFPPPRQPRQISAETRAMFPSGEETVARQQLRASTQAAPSESETTDPDVEMTPATASPVVKTGQTPITADVEAPATQSSRRGAPSGPAAVPTLIPTTQESRASGQSTTEESGEPTASGRGIPEESEEPRVSGPSAFASAAGVFGNLAPGIIQASYAHGEAKKEAERQLATAAGAQVADTVLPGAGSVISDIAGATARGPGGGRQRPTAASVLKTGQDVANLAGQLAPDTPKSAAPGPNPQAPSPSEPTPTPPQPTTTPALDTPPPAPTPQPQPQQSEQEQEQPRPSRPQGDDELAENVGEDVEKEAVQTGEKVAAKAGEEAVGETAADTALDAIPGIGEIAALALNVGLAFAGMRKPRNVPPPPAPSAQSFQAGL